MKTKIVINTFALCLVLFEVNASAKTLSEVLGEYCVPKTGEYCTNAYSAKYNEISNSCECKNSTYLKYNSVERHCEINCPAGSIAITVSTCPTGSAAIFVADNS